MRQPALGSALEGNRLRPGRLAHLHQSFDQLLVARRQVAILIEISDYQLSRCTNLRAQGQRTQLPRQMVAQRARLRQEIFKRRLVVLLKVRGRTKTRVKIVLKITSEVDLIEGVFFYPLALRRNVFRRALPISFKPGSLIQRDDRLLQLFQHRILHHLGVNHLPQLKLVQRQHADHLHQSRRQYLSL